MDERLRRTQRIRLPFEFTRVFQKGSCFRSPALRIHYLRSDRELSRLGLVVSRKVGDAVRRNRVKRLLREAFRRHRALFPFPLDIVLVAQAPPRELPEYEAAFLKFVARLGAGTPCAR